jgi:hypothetical protein
MKKRLNTKTSVVTTSTNQTNQTSQSKKPRTSPETDLSVPSTVFCEVEVTTTETHISIAELKAAVCDLHVGRFVFVKDNTNITFVVLADDINPRVVMSVVIGDSFDIHVNIFGKPLNPDHDLWTHVPSKCDSLSSISSLLDLLSNAKFCCGAKEVDIYTVTTSNVSFITSQKCQLIALEAFKGNRCHACIALRKRLLMKQLRAKKKSSHTDFTRSKRRNSYLSSPLKRDKLKQLARKRIGLLRQVSSLRCKLALYEKKSQDLIEAEGIRLTDNDCDVMLELARECKATVVSDFQPESFQQIFLEQQIKYNTLKTKASMRWHPAIIRWCLFVRSKSAKAYDGIRAYLHLPTSRTLYDYTHYTEHGLGINPKTVKQLIDQARKEGCLDVNHKSFVGILQDEVKIKSDLVYHKNTGQLIGYIHLDKVSNEILNLEYAAGRDGQLAEYMLVTMVRGISSNLSYPLSAYATKSVSASTLYSVIWECIECLELVVGLKVLYICCDGAVQNRKFFTFHGNEGELIHKTRNTYAVDERDIYFISDPPHLLKTARNCFANSFAHSNTRSLWFNQSISWKHLLQLYDEHCEQSQFRICPKLTREHMTLTSFSKMRVSLAAQVLSGTVANALEHVYGDNVRATVDFIRIMNKWFDIMNIKNIYEGRNTRNPDLLVFDDVNDCRLAWLENDFLNYFDQWNDAVKSRPGNFTVKQKNQMQLSSQTIAGFKVTSLSVAAIVRKMLDSGATFVLTNHLNQDPLEQLFGHCRHKGGSNDNPTVAEACHTINTLRTVKTQAVANARGNTAGPRTQLDFSSIPKRKYHRQSNVSHSSYSTDS